MVRGCPLLGVLLLLGLLLSALAQPRAHARSLAGDRCTPPAPCYWDRPPMYCGQIPVPLDVLVVPYGEPVESGGEGVTVVETLRAQRIPLFTVVFVVVPGEGLSTPGG
jgi:hypothetical protein